LSDKANQQRAQAKEVAAPMDTDTSAPPGTPLHAAAATKSVECGPIQDFLLKATGGNPANLCSQKVLEYFIRNDAVNVLFMLGAEIAILYNGRMVYLCMEQIEQNLGKQAAECSLNSQHGKLLNLHPGELSVRTFKHGDPNCIEYFIGLGKLSGTSRELIGNVTWKRIRVEERARSKVFSGIDFSRRYGDMLAAWARSSPVVGASVSIGGTVIPIADGYCPVLGGADLLATVVLRGIDRQVIDDIILQDLKGDAIYRHVLTPGNFNPNPYPNRCYLVFRCQNY